MLLNLHLRQPLSRFTKIRRNKYSVNGGIYCSSVYKLTESVATICIQRNTKVHGEREKFMSVKRGDIYYADLSPVVGSEQGGLRPVLIIQNDIGNRYSPTVIAAAITSRMGKTKLPTHIDISHKHKHAQASPRGSS